MPFKLLNTWLDEEKASGAPNPHQAVLSTVMPGSAPHGRVVAIREISDQGLLFFTQRRTRKVDEIKYNPQATITFWLELKQRQVIIEGQIEVLSDADNAIYWETYPREAQIRFAAYAPTSGQPIGSKQILEEKRGKIAAEYVDKALPLSPDYCGFRLRPNRFVFYVYCTSELSDVCEYIFSRHTWHKQILSP